MSAKTRGRETAADMLRTLAVVLALVFPLWYFHQGAPGTKKHIRPVDPHEAYADFVADFHGPVPVTAPPGWVCNVVDTSTVAHLLRVGYVHGDDYLEFAGSRDTGFLEDETGKATRVGAVLVGEVPWQLWRNGGGRESLLRTVAGVTVLVGGVREHATRDQLIAFAQRVR